MLRVRVEVQGLGLRAGRGLMTSSSGLGFSFEGGFRA